MPQHIWQPFSADELRRAELTPPLPFTKGMPVLQIPVLNTSPMYNNYGPGALLEHETRLYDLETDPGQLDPLQEPQREAQLAALMWSLMRAADAPVEAYTRPDFIAG